jgi:hypothetical protein
MQRAQDTSYGSSPFSTYQGNVLAPLNVYSNAAMGQVWDAAQTPVRGLNEANNFATGMINNNGMTADTNRAAGYLENFASGSGLSADQSRIAGYLDPLAAGNGLTDELRQTAGYLTPFANGSMQEDPRLASMLDTNANRAAREEASLASAKGRYGSDAMGYGVGRAIGEANNATMLQSNENSRNRQLQATGQLQNLYDNGLARKLQASGQAAGIYDSGQARKLQASGALGDLYGAGLNRAGSAMGMLPTLDALKYAGPDRAAQVGDFYQNRYQDEQNGAIQQYNERTSMPREQVEWLSGILNGMGKLGGTTSGSTIDYGKKKTGAQQLTGGLELLSMFL